MYKGRTSRSRSVLSSTAGSTLSPYAVRTDDTPKVRFSVTVGQEAEVEVTLV